MSPCRTIACALSILVFGCQAPVGDGGRAALAQSSHAAEFPALKINNFHGGVFGVFDPSIASDGPNRFVMSFSVVDTSVRWPKAHARSVSTYLARSTDQGRTWTALPRPVNKALDVVRPGAPDEPTIWQHEVSSLFFDPRAPARQRWKMIWHHYPKMAGKRRFQHGWIAYKAAPSPEGLASAREIKLMTGRAYQKENDIQNGPTGSPLGGAPAVRLNELHKDLNRCIAFTEPAAMTSKDAIYLALVCAERRFVFSIMPKVVLLKCARPCDPARGAQWAFAGVVLTAEDAEAVGAEHFSAPELYAYDGRSFLLASPASNKPFKNAYNGCVVFAFANLGRGQLVRANGKPQIVKRLEGKSNSFNGACAVHPRAFNGRFLLGQVEIRDRKPYFGIRISDVMLSK